MKLDRVLRFSRTLIATLAGFVLLAGAQAQQVPIPTTAAQVPGPPPGTAMTDAYVQAVGRVAYIWGWPLVNSINRSAAFSKAPRPGLLGGVVPVAFNSDAMLTKVSAASWSVSLPAMRAVLASGGSRGLDRSWPRPLLLPSAMAQPFARDATLLPGLGSCHGSIPQEEKRGCSASASEATSICVRF